MRRPPSNESEEEAGITGVVLGPAIGSYTYRKWGVDLTVAVFVLHVQEQHAVWDEAALRERMWISFADAELLLAPHPVAPLLPRAYALVTEGPYRLP